MLTFLESGIRRFLKEESVSARMLIKNANSCMDDFKYFAAIQICGGQCQ
jgi:hypothetical protein